MWQALRPSLQRRRARGRRLIGASATTSPAHAAATPAESNSTVSCVGDPETSRVTDDAKESWARRPRTISTPPAAISIKPSIARIMPLWIGLNA